mmetsp:Transcript_34494/g.81297  ORF Transcript_34494/g.81297 Transcript_34494/m.81297 type:complete len:252 (+) Transcript_34494:134-889(+)
MMFSIKTVSVALLFASQICSALGFVPASASFGVSSPFGTPTTASSVARRPTSFGMSMQARDNNNAGKTDRAKLAATTFNRMAGKRPQLSTKVAVIANPVTEQHLKKIRTRFQKTQPVSAPHHVGTPPLSEAHAQIARVNELSSLLAQYKRTLCKIEAKMEEDESKRASLLPKYDQMALLVAEGKQVLNALQSEYALQAMASRRARWSEEAKAAAQMHLAYVQERRSRSYTIADKLFKECTTDITETAEIIR